MWKRQNRPNIPPKNNNFWLNEEYSPMAEGGGGRVDRDSPLWRVAGGRKLRS